MGQRRVIQGTVVSDKMDKTVVVSVERRKKHRLYHKVMTLTSHFKAHDQDNECRLGDVVRIEESRPISRDKRWRVIEVVTRGDVAEVQPQAIGREIEESVQVAPAAAAAAEEQAELEDSSEAEEPDDDATDDEEETE